MENDENIRLMKSLERKKQLRLKKQAKIERRQSEEQNEKQCKSQKILSKMTTTKQLFDRIRYDKSNALNPDEFVIGYMDRFDGIQEISFQKALDLNVFGSKLADDEESEEDEDSSNEQNVKPTSLFHRIVYFKQNGVLVYDRPSKLDLLSDSKRLSTLNNVLVTEKK